MTAPTRLRLTWGGLVGVGLATLLVAGGSTFAVAAASGAFDHGRSAATAAAYPRQMAAGPSVTSCTAPALAGSVVDVELADMGAMMGSDRGMTGRDGAMIGGGEWQSYPAGMMRLAVSPGAVPHGQVSFWVTNGGIRTHEMVVLPLAAGQQPGQRRVGFDGTVEEGGSLAEASASCAAGAGDGIASGTTGWVTLTLPAGRYELICNLPGHYAGGMYTELDVS